MGYDAKAITVLGIKFDKKDFSTITKVRGCQHEITDDKSNFCPKCGTPVWIEQEVEIFENEKYNGLDIVCNTYDDGQIIIGKIIGETDYTDKIVAADFVYFDSLNSIRTGIQKVLAKRGLWQYEKCKIYTVLYESY